MNKKTVSIVMPVYQNEEKIEGIVRDFYKKLVLKLPGSEFIITEDGSTDRTRDILRNLGKELRLRLILSKERKGYIKAVKEAFSLAAKELVLLSDSDGEHSPEDFWKLCNEMEKKNVDIVVGFKQKRRPYYRLILSRINNALLGILFGISLHDANCGFRLMKKDVAKKIMPKTGTLKAAFNAEFTIRAKYEGYSYTEVPVPHTLVPSKVFSPKKLPLMLSKELLRILKLKRELR